MQKQVASFSLTSQNQYLLGDQDNKSQFVNKALDFYRKYLLWQNLQEGFSSQDDEDVALANMGMKDYWEIVNRNE